MTLRVHLRRHLLTCAAVCALAGGCAGLPRIDPSGERVLIWPKDQPQAAALAAPSSAVVAPPVVTDPFFPAPPVLAASPGAPAALGVTPAAAAIAQLPQDRVSISPERLLAPVGSEIVLKASVCTAEGYTLADQKVEWMLGRNGVGQFVEVSGKGWLHPPLLPWNKPKKVDNYLASGWTANGPMCVTRGTPDPSDDVAINRGDAWVSITSPNEGTSYVTAFMPGVESWDARKGSATIYWIDAQWNFPPATVPGGGRSAVLTTTVTRQSNGTPIEGWLVRYELADGGGMLASGAGGQVVEVRTDAAGRATVEATPTASGAPTSRVNMELVRPAGFGGGDAPRLVIGTGATVIQWTSAATPYLAPGPTTPLPADANPVTPIPTIPDGTPVAPPSTPPATTIPPIPAGRPQLEVEIRGGDQAVVGGTASFDVIIRNVGNAPATNIALTDRFQQGLMFPGDPDTREIANNAIGSLAPGESSRPLGLTFNVMTAGRLCHDVTVRSAEGAEASARACVTAAQPAPERVGRIEVNKEGPRQGFVGQSALFRVTVKNVGELPLTDITVIDEYPPSQLQVRQLIPDDLNAQRVSGTVTRRIDRLEPGQSRTLEVDCLCLQAARPVLPRPRVLVRAQTDPPSRVIETADEVELEILPPRADASGGAASPGPATGAAGGLKIDNLFFNRPARVGSRATCQVTVVNSSPAADENVEVRVVFPPELRPDVAAVQAPANVQATMVGQQLRFTPVAMLRAGERVTYTIPMNVLQSGIVDVVSGVLSKNQAAGVSRTDSLEIIPQ